MTKSDVVRATAATAGPRSAIRVTLEPSAELLALLEAHPTGELRFGPAPDTATDGEHCTQTVQGMTSRSEHSRNHGCPHCGEDFSITCPNDSPAETRDIDVSCPYCDGPILVPVETDGGPESVEVGPAWDSLPPRRIRDRVRALMSEAPELKVEHAERIARLEDELADAREEARTDPVTGLLNERAHIADRAGTAHGVMRLPLLETVYDRCGQESGNQLAHDAARILRTTAKDRVRVYRIGNGKFAFIGDDGDTMKAVLAEIATEVKEASVTAARDVEGAPTSCASIDDFIDRHPKPHGLEVRMRRSRRS